MKENIVFFFSDQQRFDTLGCNGQRLPVTPCIDALAREGVNFTSCFTPQPVCGPARSVLQSGLYPTQTGCFTNRRALPRNIKTLAMHMTQAGYNVAYVGKWHLASDKNGEDHRTTAVPPERRGGYNGYWMVSDMLEFTSHGYGGYLFDQYGNRVEFSGYRCDCLTDYAIHYINAYDSSKPFFLMVSHIEPHHQNDRNCYEGPAGLRRQFENFARPQDLEPGKGDWERFFPDYLACCRSLDDNFGRVVQALRDKGIYDDTMLVYASDHGNHFRTHPEEISPCGGTDDYKRNSFENTIHVPLVIKGRQFGGGETDGRLVSLIDLPITLMTAAGCDIDAAVQGVPLQDRTRLRSDVYIQISESYVGRALRTDRYKYVLHAPGLNPWETMTTETWTEKYLFDLRSDPLEKNNLLNNSRYRQVKEQLQKRIRECAVQAGERIADIVPCGALL